MLDFLFDLYPDKFLALSNESRQYLLAHAGRSMLSDELSRDDRRSIRKALNILMLHLNKMEQTQQIEEEIEAINEIQSPF